MAEPLHSSLVFITVTHIVRLRKEIHTTTQWLRNLTFTYYSQGSYGQDNLIHSGENRNGLEENISHEQIFLFMTSPKGISTLNSVSFFLP